MADLAMLRTTGSAANAPTLDAAMTFILAIERASRAAGSREAVAAVRLRLRTIGEWVALVVTLYTEAGQEERLSDVLTYPSLTMQLMGRDLVIECDQHVASSALRFRIPVSTYWEETGPWGGMKSRQGITGHVLTLENQDFGR